MAGIRVEPPTKITSSISFLSNPESAKAFLQGGIDRWIKESAIC